MGFQKIAGSIITATGSVAAGIKGHEELVERAKLKKENILLAKEKELFGIEKKLRTTEERGLGIDEQIASTQANITDLNKKGGALLEEKERLSGELSRAPLGTLRRDKIISRLNKINENLENIDTSLKVATARLKLKKKQRTNVRFFKKYYKEQKERLTSQGGNK